MKKKKYIILILFLGAIIFLFPKLKLVYKFYINPCFYDKPIQQNDFPQHFLKINLDHYYKEVSKLAQPFFKVDTLYNISYEAKSYPILSVSKKVSLIKSKKMLILAGVHGNESAGLFSVIEFLKNYGEDFKEYADWDLKIITPLNPVGVDNLSRYNECGCDLNRKISSSDQKGIQIQRELVDSFKPDIIISFHEAPSDGFLIHANDHISKEVLATILSEVEGKGIKLSNKDYFGRDLEQKGQSKISGILKLFNKIFNVDALGDYISPKGIAEITTESGWRTDDEFQRIQSHFYVVQSALKHFEPE